MIDLVPIKLPTYLLSSHGTPRMYASGRKMVPKMPSNDRSSCPTKNPNQDKRPLINAMKETKAIKFAIMPKIKEVAALAPLVAASRTDESFLYNKSNTQSLTKR